MFTERINVVDNNQQKRALKKLREKKKKLNAVLLPYEQAQKTPPSEIVQQRQVVHHLIGTIVNEQPLSKGELTQLNDLLISNKLFTIFKRKRVLSS